MFDLGLGSPDITSTSMLDAEQTLRLNQGEKDI